MSSRSVVGLPATIYAGSYRVNYGDGARSDNANICAASVNQRGRSWRGPAVRDPAMMMMPHDKRS